VKGVTRSKQTRPTIGVIAGWQVHAGTPDSFLQQVFRGIHAAVQDQDCNLLLAYGIGSPRGVGLGRPAWPMLIKEADFVPVGPWNTDGLIVAPPVVACDKGTPYFQALRSQGYPVVFAGSGEDGPSVVPDNEFGMRQALEHLLAHGHRHIAFIAGHKSEVAGDSVDRQRAYQTFLAEHGLESPPALLAYGSHTTPGGREAMKQILRSGVPFSAVVASNDLSAVGAWEALHEAKLSVPQDVALIGFDDRVEARALASQLTTVHYPIFEMGYQSVLLLLEYLRGQHQDVVIKRVPTRLVVRESCGCAFGEAPGLPTVWPAGSDASGNPDAVTTALTEAIYNDTQCLNWREVQTLSERLTTACRDSLRQGEPQIFQRALRSILDLIGARDDLHQGWQAALSILRERLPDWPEYASTPMSMRQIEDMFHAARAAVSATTQGQHARYIVQQANANFQVNEMTARFHVAQEEADVFAALMDILPPPGDCSCRRRLLRSGRERSGGVECDPGCAGSRGGLPSFPHSRLSTAGPVSCRPALSSGLDPATAPGRMSGFGGFRHGELRTIRTHRHAVGGGTAWSATLPRRRGRPTAGRRGQSSQKPFPIDGEPRIAHTAEPYLWPERSATARIRSR